MIQVTFDCPDMEIAGFLSAFYILYTKQDLDGNGQGLARILGPALEYLRDKLSDALGDDYLIEGYEFNSEDMEIIKAFLRPNKQEKQ